MTTTHERPVLSSERVREVQQLRAAVSEDVKIGPETEVLCVHRGRETLEDMFDSRNYTINPGHFFAPYGAAKHFKDRAVVPGSRNPESRSQVSFITIIGKVTMTESGLRVDKQVDEPVDWDPFTDEECQQYGMAFEALDRSAMVDPIEKAVTVLGVEGGEITGPATPAKPSRLRASGQATRRATRIEGSGAGVLKKRNAAGENEATRQIQEDTAAAAAERATE